MFTIDGRNLPTCYDYNGAVKVWEEAHQHDRFGGWRGLKDKRDTSKLVKKADGVVTFRYHHTDLIEWMPNQIILRTYDSQSSVVFTNCFLPSGMHARSIGGEMYVMCDGCAYMPANKYLRFNYDGEWQVDPITAARHETEVLDKKKAYRVRQIVKPFMDWRESMKRLGVPIHHERALGTFDALASLKISIANGGIPEDHYRQLAASLRPPVSDRLMDEVYVLGGAVKKTNAELGVPRKRTKYASVAAWHHV